MSSYTRHDTFVIKFFNQGLVVPATNTTRASPSNTGCPFHSTILLPCHRQPVVQGVCSPQMLRYTPPVGLTQEFCVGTSASAGCTCAHPGQQNVDDMVREIEAIIQDSRGDGPGNSSSQH
ncbi:hypothetical protein EJ02DRAFT_202337 [Clathrospora elynae]|uniref:Uncharacterized protein n=1 Tax=Clathrospora elynae TaxID=706981 RepID=A0A6A5SMQ8_9PLEO|nr:hypothetical protein EJ02DRAFT_202337 [Clathrospora elynae]